MTARSVIDIDVNDERFRAFVEQFRAYKEEASEQPAVWGAVSESVAAIGAGFAVMTAALLDQAEQHRKILDTEKQEQKERDKAAKSERDAAQRRHQALEDSKRFLRNIKDTTEQFAKWALFDFGAGALTLWGLDKLVEGVANERRLAQGFGVATGERQAIAAHMQRYFDVNSVLENVAETQADPSRRWAFAGIGVNPNGKDPAQLALETASAALRIFNQGQGNEMWAQAHGLLNFFTMDELRRMSAAEKAHPGSLAASAKQAQADWAPGGRMYLADEVSRKWQDFTTQLGAAGTALQDKLVDKLTVLEPDLSRIAAKFTDLALNVLDRIDFDELGKGLDIFTRYVTSQKFQDDFKRVIDDFGYLVVKLDRLLHLLGLLPDETPKPTADAKKTAAAAATQFGPFGGIGGMMAGGAVQGVINWANDENKKRHGEAQAAASSSPWFGSGLAGPAEGAGASEAPAGDTAAPNGGEMARQWLGLPPEGAGSGGGQATTVFETGQQPRVDVPLSGVQPAYFSLPSDPLLSGANGGPGLGDLSESTGRLGRDSGVYDPVERRDTDALNFFQSRGWSKHAAAGIVAQLDAESGNAPNPKGSNDGGQAFGAAQWHADRQRLFNVWAASNQLPDLRHSNLKEQWAFVDWELKHHFSNIAKALQAARTAHEAGVIATGYEAPADRRTSNRVRGARAEVLEVTIHNQTGASVATSVNSAAR